MVQYRIKGMECSACSARLEKVISNIQGVESCSVNLLSETMVVEGTADADIIVEAVRKAGFEGELKTGIADSKDEGRNNKALKTDLILSVSFVAMLMYFSMGSKFGLPQPSDLWVTGLIQAVLAFTVMVINRRFFISGLKAVMTFSPNMDTLVSLGSGVSFAYSCIMLTLLIAGRKDTVDLYFDSAAMILAFVTVGKLLESRSRLRTTDAVHGLMNLIPQTAAVLRDGKEMTVTTDQLKKGDFVIIRQGSVVPADGYVTEGQGSLDESSLTGESIPSEKQTGDNVYAGTVNTAGYFVYRVENTGEETVVSGIIRLVEETGASKAPIAKSADRVASVFVPFVFAAAIITFVVRFLISKDPAFSINGAISVIVISCPCSLGLATPVAITVGSGIGARLGILYKSAAVMEESGRAVNVVFDKTGTVTEGTPEVTEFICNADENICLQYVSSLENCSEHPIAGAVVRYAKSREIRQKQVQEYKLIPGKGLSGICDGHSIKVGNSRFLDEKATVTDSILSESKRLSDDGNTILYLIVDDKVTGVIAVADKIRSESYDVVDSLKKLGINVSLLTGDNRSAAERVASQLGIENVYSEVLPDEKADVIREIRKTGKTIMVGDGINDAPALVTADVGISVGNGTDIAIESADIMMTGSGIGNVPEAVKLGKAVIKNIHENLFWAFLYNTVGIPLAAGVLYIPFGIQLNPMICAAAMSLSSIFVVLNSLRLNRFPVKTTNDKQCR